MSKRVNYRVVIWPAYQRYIGGDSKRISEELVASIKRHVDDVDRVEIEFDTVCEFCGSPWEQPPLCCEAAIQEWEREHPEWTCDDEGNWRKEAEK